MHSRIFQLNTEPIGKYNYISECDYYDSEFLNDIADYINDRCDRSADIKWLQQCVKGISFGRDDNGDYLVVENKGAYFQQQFEAFQIALGQVKDCTLERFSSSDDNLLWKVNDTYEEKYGFYADVSGQVEMWDDGEIYNISRELLTFDCFVRRSIQGQKYYIGKTLDYHC